jgi:HEAT repeat protein
MNKIAILLSFAIVTSIHGQPRPAGPRMPTAAEIEGLLAKIATYQYGGDPAPAIQLDEMVGRLSGSQELRNMAEGLLLKFLQSNATPAGKEAAFRQLSLVGSNTAVPVLALLLTQIDTAEMARYALSAIPGPLADEALRKALAQAPGDRVRVGIINSLGKRRDAKSVNALAALVSSSNLEVAAAAAAALASISDRAALEALAKARTSGGDPVRGLAAEAYLVCADHLAERGDKATAVSAYRQLVAPGETSSIRIRALKSFVAADPKGAVPLLLAEIRSQDLERQVVGVQLLNRVPGAEVTKAMVAEYPKAHPGTQVQLLTAVASRGDASARPVVLAGLKSAEPAVRAASLSALGKLGDESNIKLLAETAASTEGPEQSAARESLYTIRGAGIDAAIVSALESASGKLKSELILAAGARAATAASNALVMAARDPDPEVRREALRALRNVGGAGQSSALLDMLIKSTSATERRETGLTLAAVVRRAQPAPIGMLISAYQSAPAREARMGLLDILGQTSSAEALPVLRAAIQDRDPEIARAAILALSAWDNPEPLMDLLNLARTSQRPAADLPVDSGARGGATGARGAAGPGARGAGGGGRGMAPPTSSLQVLAVRGVLRLIVLQSNRPASENGKLLGEVMSLTTQVAEKRTVLSLLSYFPSKQSLAVAEAAVRDPTVSNEARVARDQVVEGMKAK